MFTVTLIITTQEDRKILIVFDDMIADITTNKKILSLIKELFIRCRKLNISFVFITESYLRNPKDFRLISIHFLVIKMMEENYKILLRIIQQILTTKNLRRFIEIVQMILILF